MKAFLILEDGTVFEGTSIGKAKEIISEIVFNTSMTGYLEVLTDPVLCRPGRGYDVSADWKLWDLLRGYGVPKTLARWFYCERTLQAPKQFQKRGYHTALPGGA